MPYLTAKGVSIWQYIWNDGNLESSVWRFSGIAEVSCTPAFSGYLRAERLSSSAGRGLKMLGVVICLLSPEENHHCKEMNRYVYCCCQPEPWIFLRVEPGFSSWDNEIFQNYEWSFKCLLETSSWIFCYKIRMPFYKCFWEVGKRAASERSETLTPNWRSFGMPACILFKLYFCLLCLVYSLKDSLTPNLGKTVCAQDL